MIHVVVQSTEQSVESQGTEDIMAVAARLLIFVLCTFLQFNNHTIDTPSIAILLVTLILSSLSIIINVDFNGNKGHLAVLCILWSIYLILSLFIADLRYFIPLAMIDISSFRLIIPFIIAFICIITNCLSSMGFFIIMLSAIAVILQYLNIKNEMLSYELRKLRDTSKEHELLIEEKNHRLIERQDAELYTATLKERNRIAREIHDNVGHMLTRSILQVGAIKTINSDENLNDSLGILHETLNTAMTNIRNSVHDLHDESIDLKMAVNEIIDSVDSISISFDYDMSINIPKNIKYCFITITKEAINNTIKHSNATHMDIMLQEHPAFYQLMIQDNGTDIKSNISDGIGLTNMRDRVKSLGGNIKISTEQGFKILVSIIKNGE